LRGGWLHKGLDALRDDPRSLSSKTSHHELGVGKNMAEAIRYWTVASKLARPGVRSRESRVLPLHLTNLGELLIECDPYLEDRTTLWLLHIGLATNRDDAPAWYWLFNESEPKLWTNELLAAEFGDWLEDEYPGQSISDLLVRREIACLVRTYAVGDVPRTALLEEEQVSPLTDLALLRRTTRSQVTLNFGAAKVPRGVFQYTLFRYAQRKGDEVYSLDELRWARESPGRLLCLDTRALQQHLHDLAEPGPVTVQLSQGVGLRNVAVKCGFETEVIKSIFDGS
jgi:hypothetical protein